jgi:hypothetical protein
MNLALSLIVGLAISASAEISATGEATISVPATHVRLIYEFTGVSAVYESAEENARNMAARLRSYADRKHQGITVSPRNNLGGFGGSRIADGVSTLNSIWQLGPVAIDEAILFAEEASEETQLPMPKYVVLFHADQKSVETIAVREATLIAQNRAQSAAEAFDMKRGSIVHVEVANVLIRESGIIGLESFSKRDSLDMLCTAKVNVRFSLTPK